MNNAIGYLSRHSDQLRIDKNKLILAGDSAGAQIAAQVALINTNSGYASKLGIAATVGPRQIARLLLNCGPYDISLVNPESTDQGAQLVRLFLWSYTGDKHFYQDPHLQYASIPQFVTSDFPPSFITAGNADPLLQHSINLAHALEKVHVTTTTLFYPENYTPTLNHEYQFNLDTKEGKQALDAMVQFANSVTSK